MQSVVLGNQTPIRSQGILLLTNERRGSGSFCVKFKSANFGYRDQANRDHEYETQKFPALEHIMHIFNMSNIELIFRLHENKEPKTHHREISYSTIKKLKLKGLCAI